MWTVLQLFLLIVVFLFGLRKLSDADLGFHLRGGQFIIQEGHFPDKDTYTYTVTQNDYIDLHWMFQIILYLIYLAGGYSGITIYKSVLVLLLFLLLWIRGKQLRASMLLMVTLLLAGIICIQSRLLMRPELFTYIFLTCFLLILDPYYRQHKGPLFLLPLIMILWVNSQGLFILGWFVTGAYFLGDWVRSGKADRKLLLYGFLVILVSFLNPYFHRGVYFPFYLFTRFDSNNVFNNIIEFKSVLETQEHFTSDFILFYLLAAIAVGLFIATFRKRRIHEFLILSVFIYLAFTAIRNIPLFVIVSILFIASAGSDLIPGHRHPLKKIRGMRLKEFVGGITAVIMIVVMVRLLTNAFYTEKRQDFKTGTGLDSLEQPVKASMFMLRHHLDGKIINDLNIGGWLAWSIPQKTFIDGRLEVVQEDFYTEYLTSQQEGGLQAILRQYQPQILLFDYESNISWIMQINLMREWRLVYLDEKTAIYLRKGYRDDLPDYQIADFIRSVGIDTSDYTDEAVKSILAMDRVPWMNQWMKGMYRKSSYLYPRYLKPAMFADLTARYTDAEPLYLEFMNRDGLRYYNVLQNLGMMYFRQGELKKSRLCWLRLLQIEPDHRLGKQYLQQISQLQQKKG